MDKFDVGFTIYMMILGGTIGLMFGVLLGVNVQERKLARRCVETLAEVEGVPAETLVIVIKAFCGG